MFCKLIRRRKTMSRIGKMPITLPEGVEVNITDTNLVKVKGKLGELEQLVDPAITVKVEEGRVVLERATGTRGNCEDIFQSKSAGHW